MSRDTTAELEFFPHTSRNFLRYSFPSPLISLPIRTCRMQGIGLSHRAAALSQKFIDVALPFTTISKPQNFPCCRWADFPLRQRAGIWARDASQTRNANRKTASSTKHRVTGNEAHPPLAMSALGGAVSFLLDVMGLGGPSCLGRTDGTLFCLPHFLPNVTPVILPESTMSVSVKYAYVLPPADGFLSGGVDIYAWF